MLRRLTLAALVVLSSTLPIQAAPDPDEWEREIDADPYGNPADDEGIWIGVVIDAVTREPIAGATVAVPATEGRPAPDLLRILRSAKTDARGRFRLRYDDLDTDFLHYFFVDAPGHAPSVRPRPQQGTLELWPGVDVPILLLDHVGRPAPGVRVGYTLGCGHVLDQRSAVTDERGRAVIESVLPLDNQDAGLWIGKEGLGGGSVPLSGFWRSGDPPVIVHCPSGRVVTGRVVRPDGTPIPRLLVGSPEWQRPWARTDGDGRFRLVGMTPYERIEVDPGDGTWANPASFIAPPAGVPRTLVVPHSPVDPEPRHDLDVSVRTRAKEPTAKIRVVVLRPADGLTVTDHTGADGRVTLSVPPGRLEARAVGGAGPHGSVRIPVPDGASAIELIVPALPTIRIDASRLRPDHRLMLTTPRNWRRLRPQDLEAGLLPVPAERPAVIRVAERLDGEVIVRCIPIPAADTEAFGRTLVLEGHRPTTVVATLTGPDGAAAPAWAMLCHTPGYLPDRASVGDDEPPSSRLALRTPLVGTLDLFLVPESPALAWQRRTVRIPDRTRARIDLGEIRLEALGPSRLRIDLPESERRSGATAILRREGWEHELPVKPDGSVDPGGFLDLRAGDVVSARWGWSPEVTRRLTGPPPWRVPYHLAELRLICRTVDGRDPVDGYVRVDGEEPEFWFGPESDEDVPDSRIQAGAHEILVAAKGYRIKVRRVVLRPGETRRVEVVLNRR